MEILAGYLINLGLPLAGIALFLWLKQRMGPEHPSPIVVFLLFAHYGACLVILLTAFFWYWSGMAGLGVIYLMTLGPLVMLALAIITFKDRQRSIHHRLVFIAAASYPVLALAVILFVLLVMSTIATMLS